MACYRTKVSPAPEACVCIAILCKTTGNHSPLKQLVLRARISNRNELVRNDEKYSTRGSEVCFQTRDLLMFAAYLGRPVVRVKLFTAITIAKTFLVFFQIPHPGIQIKRGRVQLFRGFKVIHRHICINRVKYK